MPFKVGDKVEWTSQSGGTWKTKTGFVVAVVPAGKDPKTVLPDWGRLDGTGEPRLVESYLVQQGRRIRLNWPFTSKLSLAGAAVPFDGIDEFLEDSTGAFSECKDIPGVLEVAGRLLDKAESHEIIGDCVFRLKSGKVMVATVEVHVAEASPEYVKSLKGK